MHTGQTLRSILGNTVYYLATDVSRRTSRRIGDVTDIRAEEFQAAQVTAEWWRLETRLWDLIHRLYEFRWRVRNENNEDQNIGLQETKIILDWLQETAPRNTEHDHIPSNRWFLTRESIKMQNVTGRTNDLDRVVSELDPDAALRQGKGLMEADEEDERKLLKQIFQYLRSGDLKGAQQACRDSNNQWRAASLSGMSSDKPNSNWRKMCFQLARQPQVDRYERAIYGVVCGDLDSVLPVCQTWEDYLWAHFNAVYAWKLEEVNPM
jgi:nuclear pore complex protein Nup107